MKRFEKYNRLWALSLLLLAISACGKKTLVPLETIHRFSATNTATVDVDFCTMDADEVKAKLKFIVAVDRSGSNLPSGSSPGTDPNGYRRFTPLLTFLNSNSDDPTVYYSMINFSTDANLVQGLTNDRTGFISTVEDEHNPGSTTPPLPADGGWTNYLAALAEARDLIQADIAAEKALDKVTTSHYVIFFISDGQPYVNQTTLQTTPEILDSIDSIKAPEISEKEYVGSIRLSTGYYTNTIDPAARLLLQQMANQGDGDYFEFDSGQVIDFKQFAIPDRSAKHFLDDIIVFNPQHRYRQAQIVLDTDKDGIADIDELIYGSDSENWDSDGNGVSDGVEFAMTGKPCKDDSCAPSGAEPYNSCARFERSGLPNGQKYLDRDNDGLNDCEEADILGSSDASADSNGDGIPDFLAFNRNIAFIEGIRDTHLDPDWDDVLNYKEVKVNSPTNINNDRISGLKTYKYTLETVSQSPVRDCYRLKVEDVVIVGETNTLGVYIMESTSVIDDQRFMRYAEQNVSGGETATFMNSDFK